MGSTILQSLIIRVNMGIKLEIGNILKLPQILKIPECGLTFICLMLYRIETCKTVNNVEVCFSLGYASNSVDAGYLANLACVGFFFISLVQIISTLLGDKTPIQDILFALCGFFFFIGSGSKGAADIVSGTWA